MNSLFEAKLALSQDKEKQWFDLDVLKSEMSPERAIFWRLYCAELKRRKVRLILSFFVIFQIF